MEKPNNAIEPMTCLSRNFEISQFLFLTSLLT